MTDEELTEIEISSENIFDGVLLHVKRDYVKLPNGKTSVREWITHPGASAVIPYFEDGTILLVKQYRYPIKKVTYEIPAGKMDVKGEDPIECAKRELSEETGYCAESYHKLSSIATTVGFTNEIIHIYVAEKLKSGAQHTDEDEFINVVRVSLKDAVKMVNEGEIYDAKSVTAILMLESYIKNR